MPILHLKYVDTIENVWDQETLNIYNTVNLPLVLAFVFPTYTCTAFRSSISTPSPSLPLLHNLFPLLPITLFIAKYIIQFILYNLFSSSTI